MDYSAPAGWPQDRTYASEVQKRSYFLVLAIAWSLCWSSGYREQRSEWSSRMCRGENGDPQLKPVSLLTTCSLAVELCGRSGFGGVIPDTS